VQGICFDEDVLAAVERAYKLLRDTQAATATGIVAWTSVNGFDKFELVELTHVMALQNANIPAPFSDLAKLLASHQVT
jgi:hypothetical protein